MMRSEFTWVLLLLLTIALLLRVPLSSVALVVPTCRCRTWSNTLESAQVLTLGAAAAAAPI
jgi:hypothetical protein